MGFHRVSGVKLKFNSNHSVIRNFGFPGSALSNHSRRVDLVWLAGTRPPQISSNRHIALCHTPRWAPSECRLAAVPTGKTMDQEAPTRNGHRASASGGSRG